MFAKNRTVPLIFETSFNYFAIIYEKKNKGRNKEVKIIKKER